MAYGDKKLTKQDQITKEIDSEIQKLKGKIYKVQNDLEKMGATLLLKEKVALRTVINNGWTQIDMRYHFAATEEMIQKLKNVFQRLDRYFPF